MWGRQNNVQGDNAEVRRNKPKIDDQVKEDFSQDKTTKRRKTTVGVRSGRLIET